MFRRYRINQAFYCYLRMDKDLLFGYLDAQYMKRQFCAAYENLAKAMIDVYYSYELEKK